MIKVTFEDISQILRDMTGKIKKYMAKTLNEIGEAVTDAIAEELSEMTGLGSEEIKPNFHVTPATEESPTYEMDASMVVPEPTEWARPWEKRSSSPFESNTLVKIVTAGDDKVCPICTAAARNSPYTLAETNKMFAKWAHVMFPGLLHPRCRCNLEPWDIGGRSSPFKPGGSVVDALMKFRRIGSGVASTLKVDKNG